MKDHVKSYVYKLFVEESDFKKIEYSESCFLF